MRILTIWGFDIDEANRRNALPDDEAAETSVDVGIDVLVPDCPDTEAVQLANDKIVAEYGDDFTILYMVDEDGEDIPGGDCFD